MGTFRRFDPTFIKLPECTIPSPWHSKSTISTDTNTQQVKEGKTVNLLFTWWAVTSYNCWRAGMSRLSSSSTEDGGNGTKKPIRCLSDHDRFPIATEIPIVFVTGNWSIASHGDQESANRYEGITCECCRLRGIELSDEHNPGMQLQIIRTKTHSFEGFHEMSQRIAHSNLSDSNSSIRPVEWESAKRTAQTHATIQILWSSLLYLSISGGKEAENTAPMVIKWG